MKHGNFKHSCLAFTLIEVVASIAILVFLLSSVFVLHERTSGNVITQTLRQRAMSVAQRQMEILIAVRQEPDGDEASGWDEFDPLFQWHIDLRRESFTSTPPKPDLSNTVIKATVTVEWDDLSNQSYDVEEFDWNDDDYDQDYDDQDWVEDDWEEDNYYRPRNQSNRLSEVSTKIELVRYFEHAGFKPIVGQSVAVPMTRETPPEPQWYVDMVDRLGREPTPQEVIAEMFRQGDILQSEMDEQNFDEDEEQDDSEGDLDDGGPKLPVNFPDLKL